MKDQYLLYFAGICVVVFFISFIKDKKGACMNFALRAIFGILSIYFLNKLFYHYGIMVNGKVLRAGINFYTITISGILGIPGIGFIYLLLDKKSILC